MYKSSSITRRNVLELMTGFGLSLAMPGMSACTAARRRTERPKSLITLWMGGGMSQLESWDPHPGSPANNRLRSIPTSIDRLEISEFLPQMAE